MSCGKHNPRLDFVPWQRLCHVFPSGHHDGELPPKCVCCYMTLLLYEFISQNNLISILSVNSIFNLIPPSFFLDLNFSSSFLSVPLSFLSSLLSVSLQVVRVPWQGVSSSPGGARQTPAGGSAPGATSQIPASQAAGA